MLSDYHVHSNFSFDSEESPDNIVSRAIELGMPCIAITDHQDFNWPVEGEFPYIDFDNYFSTLDELSSKYEDKIKIIKGIELGLVEDAKSQCQNLIKNNAFDFVIGSCHIVDNMDPYYSGFWKNRKDLDAFELYFKTLLNGIKSFDRFDTLGHMDYIVRYSPNKDTNYSVLDYRDIIDEILTLIISKNIKLEINTANLAKGFSFPNPHTDIIKRYKELGGEYVTVGSDAHTAENIGYGFDVAEEIIKNFNLNIFTIK